MKTKQFFLITAILIAVFISSLNAQIISDIKLKTLKTTTYSGDRIFCASNSNDIYYITPNRWFSKSSDFCQTWERIQHVGAGGVGPSELAFSNQTSGLFYAFGAYFQLNKTNDGGNSWQLIDNRACMAFAAHTGNDQILYAAFFENDNEYNIYKSTNGGSSWNNLNSINGLPSSNEFHINTIVTVPDAPEIVYILIPTQGLYKSTNSGENFTLVSSGYYGNAESLYVQSSDGSKLLLQVIYDDSSDIIYSDDGGQNWSEPFATESGVSVLTTKPDDPNVLIGYNTTSQRIIKSNDRGQTFEEVGPVSNYISGLGNINIRFANGNTNYVFAVYEGFKKMLVSQDAGDSWEIIDPPTDSGSEINSTGKQIISLSEGNHAMVTTGFYNTYDRNSDSWTSIPVDNFNNDRFGYLKKAHNDVNKLWTLTHSGKLFHSTDGGSNWTQINSISNWDIDGVSELISIGDNDSQSYLFYNSHNSIYKSYDDGYSFEEIEIADVNHSITSIEQAPSDLNTLYISTNGGNMYKSTDLGSTWVLLTNSPASICEAWSGSGFAIHPTNSDIVVAYSNNTIYKTIDGGDTWNVYNNIFQNLSFFAKSIFVFDKRNPNILYSLAVNQGNFYLVYSMDAGASWSEENSYLLVSEEIDDCLGHIQLFGDNLISNNKLYVYMRFLGFFEVEISETLGIDEKEINRNCIEFYPNPSNGQIIIKPKNQYQNIQIEIAHINGQIIYKEEYKNIGVSEQIDLKGLAKGIYIVKMQGNDFLKTEKLIIE